MSLFSPEHRGMKTFGAIVLALLVGFAAGNGWTTRSALEGSEQWWRGHARSEVKSHIWQQRRKDLADCRKQVQTMLNTPATLRSTEN